MAAGAMASLDAQDVRFKREALAIDIKAAEIEKARNIQQIYERARGPIDIKRRQEELRIAQAELGVIGVMSSEKQAMLLAEIQGRERIAIIEADNARIIKETNRNKGLTQAEKEATFRGLSDRLANAKAEVALDAQALNIAQQRSLIEGAAQETNRIYEEIEARKLRNELALKGVAPEIIEGEVRVLALQKALTVALEAHDKQLAKLTGTTYDGTTATYEFAIARLNELKALGELTPAQEALSTSLEKELKARQGIMDLTGGAIQGARGAAQASVPEYGDKLRTFIADGQRELKDLEQVAINVSQSIGNAVGNSLASGISGLIEGTTTAKEVFANFLRDIGQTLVQEGTKMIAMYIAIAIAKAIAGLGSSGSGDYSGAFKSTPGTSFGDALKMPKLAANGATFANGVATFAKGGTFTNSIVSSPTLFKFADGGAMQTGLMGEAGPEAIMPLKRGADGSLGVQANGLREAMDRQQGGASSAPVLNMSFQSTSINGVEYVSREQLEQAMAETRRASTRDGAKRGMTMTLDRIQNSNSTRQRVGI
jgi:hypothetical protein